MGKPISGYNHNYGANWCASIKLKQNYPEVQGAHYIFLLLASHLITGRGVNTAMTCNGSKEFAEIISYFFLIKTRI